VVGHIRIRTTNYQYHTVTSVYLHIAAPLFRLSRIGIDFSRAIRLAIFRPTARLFGFAHVFDVYTSSYCAQLRAAFAAPGLRCQHSQVRPSASQCHPDRQLMSS
jgi:hypothetical protein